MPVITLWQVERGPIEVPTEDIKKVRPLKLWENSNREVYYKRKVLSNLDWKQCEGCKIILKGGKVIDVIEARWELDKKIELANG